MSYETNRNPTGSTEQTEDPEPVDPPDNQGGTAADDGGNTTPSDI